MGIDLPVVWAVIIAFGLMMYVIMDGFDLGIGILFPFVREREDRDTMVNTVAPVWDVNERWKLAFETGVESVEAAGEREPRARLHAQPSRLPGGEIEPSATVRDDVVAHVDHIRRRIGAHPAQRHVHRPVEPRAQLDGGGLDGR